MIKPAKITVARNTKMPATIKVACARAAVEVSEVTVHAVAEAVSVVADAAWAVARLVAANQARVANRATAVMAPSPRPPTAAMRRLSSKQCDHAPE